MRILLDESFSAFDVFLTADQNLQYQQNLKDHEIRVVVLAPVGKSGFTVLGGDVRPRTSVFERGRFQNLESDLGAVP